jgi:hypothetical protein
MTDQSRIDEFRSEVEALKLKTGAGSSERILQIVGAVLMVAGIVVALVAYVTANGQNSGDLAIDNLEHNELIILSLAGVAMSITGGFMFLRYSLATFFRFWLLRQIYESRTLIEELGSVRSTVPNQMTVEERLDSTKPSSSLR